MNGSPYIVSANNSVRITMFKVLVALLPGIFTHAWFFGAGILVSLIVCTLLAVLFEGLSLTMRGYPLKPFLGDGSVIVTAWLFALSVPTLAPIWLYAVGLLFAVIVAKHLYGGLGQNPFNPAMVGYAVLIVSFPVYMTQWAAPLQLAVHTPTLAEAFDLVFAGGGSISADAYTLATPLDTLKTLGRAGQSASEIFTQPIFGLLGGKGGEWVAMAYALGGMLLLANRVMTWHVPLAFLLSVALSAEIVGLVDPSPHGGALFHLFSGGVMLGAFFIATDPVSGCGTPLGKLIFAGVAGFLTVMIRDYGGYPDGVAFSVLLMNVAAPFIDAYTQPRVFGHARRGERRRT
jgi:Na+-translocating ferredoxin:NAD+ oxidoreductase subunit D